MFSFLVMFFSSALAFERTSDDRKIPDNFLACHTKILDMAQSENKNKYCFIGFTALGYRNIVCNSKAGDESINDNSNIPFISLSGAASIKANSVMSDLISIFFWKMPTQEAINTISKIPTCVSEDLRWWRVD